jgi:hypothetical protein
MTIQTVSWDELVALRRATKVNELLAVAERREVDAEIARRLADPSKPEGTITQQVGDVKVKAVFKIERKPDVAALQTSWAQLPESVQGVFKWSADVGVRALRALSADDAAVAAKYYESKPGSTSVELE